MTQDLGAEALQKIADVWKVDRARVIWTKNGFDWWPGEHRVSVAVDHRTPAAWQLSVRTDFAKNAPIGSARFTDEVALYSTLFGSTYAWVYRPLEAQDRAPDDLSKLWFASAACLTVENARWLPRFFANISAMQFADARFLTTTLPTAMAGGTPDVSLPASLSGSEPINVLRWSETIASQGDSASRWFGTGELEEIANRWNRTGRGMCRADRGALVLQTSFRESAVKISLLTQDRHPRIGNGLLGILELPHPGDRRSTVARCAMLNLTEVSSGEGNLFGCWSPSRNKTDRAFPRFLSFIPNSLYAREVAPLMLASLYQRAQLVMTAPSAQHSEDPAFARRDFPSVRAKAASTAVKNDIRAEALRKIADIWHVDQARVIETRDGFDWWPDAHRVSVSATRRTDGHTPGTWMLSVKTDFLKEIPIGDDRFVKHASMTSGIFGVTFAWVFPIKESWRQHGRPGERPRLWFCNTAYLREEDAFWLPEFLARMSILQPIEARAAAATSKLIGGGVPDSFSSKTEPSAKVFSKFTNFWRRPRGSETGAERPTDHPQRKDVLSEILASYAESGEAPNKWIGTGEFEQMAEGWQGARDWEVSADRDGFTLKTDVGGQPAMIRLSTHEKHPRLGNGLHCNLKLPVFDRTKATAERCAAWNLRETFWTDIPQFGSWFPYSLPDDHACPQFSQLIPNALYGPGIAPLTVNWLYQRFRLVFYGEHPTPG